MTRLSNIDGLKGYMAICVFWCHFNGVLDMGFVPPCTGLCLFTFFCLSGFSLSLSLSQKSQEQINRTIVGRYFRIAIPMAVVTTACYLLYLLGIYHPGNLQVSFKYYVKMCFLSPLGYFALDNPTWMLKYIFWGTYLVIILHYLTKDMTLKKSLFVLATVSVFAVILSRYYCAIVIGMIIYKVYQHVRSSNVNYTMPWYFTIPLLLVALFMSYLHNKVHNSTYVQLCQMIGCIPLIVAVLFSTPLQKIFSSKPFAFCGNIFFEIFILHYPIVYTFSILLSSTKWGSIIWLNFILTLTLVLITSYSMAKYLSPRLRLIEKRIVDFILT